MFAGEKSKSWSRRDRQPRGDGDTDVLGEVPGLLALVFMRSIGGKLGWLSAALWLLSVAQN